MLELVEADSYLYSVSIEAAFFTEFQDFVTCTLSLYNVVFLLFNFIILLVVSMISGVCKAKLSQALRNRDIVMAISVDYVRVSLTGGVFHEH